MAPNNNFHPALAVANIRNNVPLILDEENVPYATWAELFKNTAKAHRVLHHIIAPEKGKEKTPTTDEEVELYNTLDATVLGWIYTTVSKPLLNSVVEPGSTAMEAWERVRKMFQDNENSRAVTLESEFTRTSMDDFPNASAYCQRLKELSDQLRDVQAPVTNNRLVLQLIAGLSDGYKNVGTILRHRKTMPSFSEARSMLTLEETSMNPKNGSAMVANTNDNGDSPVFGPTASSSANGGRNKAKNNYKGKNQGGGRNGGKNSGRGGSNSGGRGGGGQQQAPFTPWGWQPPNWNWQQTWAAQQPTYALPCPFPSTRPSWARPNPNAVRSQHQQASILGPKPQAYSASLPPSQTDIEAAMYTLGLTPPDPNWYMDTGATSHMTSQSGFPDGDESNEM